MKALVIRDRTTVIDVVLVNGDEPDEARIRAAAEELGFVVDIKETTPLREAVEELGNWWWTCAGTWPRTGSERRDGMPASRAAAPDEGRRDVVVPVHFVGQMRREERTRLR